MVNCVYEDFLKYVDIDPKNVHFPDGTVPRDQVNEYCKSYEQKVRGQVDLMIIRIVNFYVDTRGEILGKHFLLMACLMETSISEIRLSFSLKASFNLTV